MKQSNRQNAIEILDAIGGSKNVKSVFHCMTRLRVILKDESLFDEKAINNIEVVKGINKSGDQFQIILGTGTVTKVYSEVITFFDDSEDISKIKGSKNPLQNVISVLGDVFIPILPAIIAAGILMGLRSFCVHLGILAEDGVLFLISQVLTDTAYTFLPVMVAWSSMKRFGGDPVLGIVIGLMMINPLLPARAAIARDTAEYLVLAIGPINLNIAGFQGTVLPSLFIGMVGAYSYKWSLRVIPDYLSQILVPVITTFCSLVIGLVVLGPIFSVVENYVMDFYIFLLQLPLGIGGFITGFLQQFLVITGLHHALIIIDLNLLAETGENMFIAVRNAAVFGQAGAALSIAIFSKVKETRATAGSSTLSAVFGITEPAIFGVNLPLGRPFLYGAIGSGFGAMFGVIMGLTAPGTVNGIPGMLQVLGDPYMLSIYVIQAVIAMAIPLVLTYTYIKKKGI